MIFDYLIDVFVHVMRIIGWIFAGFIILAAAGMILAIIVTVVKEKGAGSREEKAKDTRVD